MELRGESWVFDLLSMNLKRVSCLCSSLFLGTLELQIPKLHWLAYTWKLGVELGSSGVYSKLFFFFLIHQAVSLTPHWALVWEWGLGKP